MLQQEHPTKQNETKQNNRLYFCALQELWLPVMVPAHSTTIDVSVWHKEMTGREVIAHAFFDLNSVREMSGTSDGEKR